MINDGRDVTMWTPTPTLAAVLVGVGMREDEPTDVTVGVRLGEAVADTDVEEDSVREAAGEGERLGVGVGDSAEVLEAVERSIEREGGGFALIPPTRDEPLPQRSWRSRATPT